MLPRGWLTKSVFMPLVVVAALVAAGSSSGAPPPPNVLAVELAVDIDYVDPALAYYVPTWTIEYATCAKLLNYPDRDAPVGGLLQPEVAAGMPLVSPDGRTYSFQIRDDFFFAPSNERVTAASFKHAIDRALNKNMASPAQPFLRDIVGADAVIRGDTTSTSGVVVDGKTLRITLVAPSADFLARLTMPFACPLPLSVGIVPGGIGAPVPSAGPYYIESWMRGSSIVVKENPFYTGDRPHHFDEIRYGIGLPLETIKLRIDSGETDLGDIPPAAHAELAPLYGPGSQAALLGRQRWFAFPSPTVLYLAMNHDRSLFGDDPATGPGLDPRGNVALKQAVNYAIDRTAMMAQRGAYAGAPTDQHLPYEMGGFRDVDIYPAHPDVARARELAGWSPGDPIRNGVLYCANTAPSVAICNIVQASLREIGLEMEIKLFPRTTQFELAGRRGEPFDMTLEGWHMDYYDPFDFLFLLDGELLQPVNNVNFAYFNDPVYNARIDAANLLSGPARADAFGDLEIDIARNAAPWAPYGVPNDRYYFSDRVGCQEYVPPYTLSLGALCLRPAISIADAEVAEGDSGTRAATFTVTLSEAAAADYPVGVAFSTSEGTAGGGDFVARSGLVTFGSGEKTKTIAIDILGDTTHESDESFTVQLSAATKGTIVDDRATGTIRNDDPAPPAPPQTDTQAPVDPIVRSTSHVTGRTSRDRTIDVTWTGASDNDSGVDGFSFHWDRQPSTLPDAVKDMEETATQTTSPALANGSWYFHLRTRDNAGNWTATRHLGPFVIFVPRALRCVVPNVRGRTVPAARTSLARAKCSLGRVTRGYSPRVRKGRIISQSRRPGARLPRGTKVNLLVSRGKRRR